MPWYCRFKPAARQVGKPIATSVIHWLFLSEKITEARHSLQIQAIPYKYCGFKKNKLTYTAGIKLSDYIIFQARKKINGFGKNFFGFIFLSVLDKCAFLWYAAQCALRRISMTLQRRE